MGFVRILLFALAALVAAALGFAAYLGAFKSVEIEEGPFGPVAFVYGTHVGPYSELSKSWTVFLEDAAEKGIAVCDSLGVYLDPPGTPEDEQRAILGCRIDSMDEAARAAATSALPSFEIPQSTALLSAFPFKNVASYFLGPMKVYPAMKKELEASTVTPTVAVELYGKTTAQGVVDGVNEIAFAMPLDLDQSAFAPLEAAFVQ